MRKILIVEDDTNIAELLHLYLEKEGFETVVANERPKQADAEAKIVALREQLAALTK